MIVNVMDGLDTAKLRRDLCYIAPIDRPRTTKGGLHLPDKTERRHGWGVIINMGPEVAELGVEVGDYVVFDRLSGIEFETSKGEQRCLVCSSALEAVWR